MLSTKLFLLALVSIAAQVSAVQIISVTNGGPLGSWGPLELCPEGSVAIGYQTQNDLILVPVHDDTALNSIRLFCNDPDRTNITSSVGFTGTWELRQNCPEGSFLSSFRLRVAPYDSEASDNSAAHSIQFVCTDGTVLNFNGNSGGVWGDFSSGKCGAGICGLQTRVQAQGGPLTDNTALNDVTFLCC